MDPASNACGVMLLKDGEYVWSETLHSLSTSDPFSKRLRDIREQFDWVIEKYVGRTDKIHRVICEGVRSRLVQICIGALLTHPQIDVRLHQKRSFVETPEWKKWARLNGATDKDPKGIKSLIETGWKGRIGSDDEADCGMIYMTWVSLYVQ